MTGIGRDRGGSSPAAGHGGDDLRRLGAASAGVEGPAEAGFERAERGCAEDPTGALAALGAGRLGRGLGHRPNQVETAAPGTSVAVAGQHGPPLTGTFTWNDRNAKSRASATPPTSQRPRANGLLHAMD